MYIKLLYVHVAAVTVRGSSHSRHVDRLSIRPDAAVITKRLGGSVVLTCLARQVPGDNSNEPTELRWIDPSGHVILDRTGRRQVSVNWSESPVGE
jgi:hypothetical protein